MLRHLVGFDRDKTCMNRSTVFVETVEIRKMARASCSHSSIHNVYDST